MPIEQTLEYEELECEFSEILLKRSLIFYDHIGSFVQAEMLYTSDELLTLSWQVGLNRYLQEAGFKKINRGNAERTSTPILQVLKNLWANGYVRKFCKGDYVRSGRPYGVRWLVKWE
jgi:hypothetical protein